MFLNEIKRNEILYKQLGEIGIKGIMNMSGKCIFPIETSKDYQLQVISELKATSILMTIRIKEEIDPNNIIIMHIVSEFFHRINISLVVGKFELDYDNGHMWFSVSSSYSGDFPSNEVICRLISLICLTCDQYLPLLPDVINMIMYPKAAFEYAEKKDTFHTYIKNHIDSVIDKLVNSSNDDKSLSEYQFNPSDKSVDETISFSKEFQDLIHRLGYDI